jgi:hypothetical protein
MSLISLFRNVVARSLATGLEKDLYDQLLLENAALRRELAETQRERDEHLSSEFAQGSVGPPTSVPHAHVTRVANLKAVVIDLIAMNKATDHGWISMTDQMRLRTAEAVLDKEEPDLG